MKTPADEQADAVDPRRSVPIHTRVSAEMYRWLQAEQSRHFVTTGSKLPISGVVRMLLERMQGKAGRASIRRIK
jgi:hypothetical protein